MNDDGQPTGRASTPTLTLALGKAIALDTLRKIIETIPREDVTTSIFSENAHLLSCSKEQFQWPGDATLGLAPDVDAERLLATLESEWNQRDGFDAWLESNRDGTSMLNIRGSRGDTYYAFAQSSGRELAMGSFSPCFDLPDGNLFDEY